MQYQVHISARHNWVAQSLPEKKRAKLQQMLLSSKEMIWAKKLSPLVVTASTISTKRESSKAIKLTMIFQNPEAPKKLDVTIVDFIHGNSLSFSTFIDTKFEAMIHAAKHVPTRCLRPFCVYLVMIHFLWLKLDGECMIQFTILYNTRANYCALYTFS